MGWTKPKPGAGLLSAGSWAGLNLNKEKYYYQEDPGLE